MEKFALIAAHPDDLDAMMGYAAAQSPETWAIIATDGEASTIDLIGGVGRSFCPG